MAIWNPVFLHEFVDGNPANLRALPGELAVLPNGLAITPTPAPEDRGFLASPGRLLGYQLARGLDNVIGVDLAVDLAFSPRATGSEYPVVSLGGGRVRLDVRSAAFAFVGPNLEGRARLSFAVDGSAMEFDLDLVPARTERLRLRWHTHGQAQVWRAGALHAYEPSLAVGRVFNVDRLLLGGPNGAVAESPQFLARRVYVKLLRRDDARSELAEQVSIDTRLLPRTPCARAVSALLGELLVRIRKFMSETIAQTTSTWRAGQAHAPFSPPAIAAHRSAVAAAEALVAFLASRAPMDADRFLEHIGVLFDTLAGVDPPRYAAMLEELDAQARTLDEHCRAELMPLRLANAAALDPFEQLFTKTWERANAAGGGPHA